MCDWTGCGHRESLSVACLHRTFVVCFFWFWPNLRGVWLTTEQTGLQCISCSCTWAGASQVTSGKEPTCRCRRHSRLSFGPLLRKILWRKAWQPTPIFLPGESMGREAWWAKVYGVTQHQTWLKRLSTHTHICSWIMMADWNTSVQAEWGWNEGELRKVLVSGSCTLLSFYAFPFLPLFLRLHVGGGRTTLTVFTRRCPH